MHIGTGGDEPQLVRPYIADQPGSDRFGADADAEATVVLHIVTATSDGSTAGGAPAGELLPGGSTPADAAPRGWSGRLAIATGIVLATAVLPTAFALIRQSDRADSADAQSPTWGTGVTPGAPAPAAIAPTSLRGQVGDAGADDTGRAGNPEVSRPAVLAGSGPAGRTVLAVPPAAIAPAGGVPLTPAPPAPPPVAPAIVPTSVSPPPPLNLALLRPVLASSIESPQFEARYAVDGDPATRWSSAGRDKQWIQVDLGRVVPVSEVHIAWQEAHAARYEVRLSIDGKRWHTRAKESHGDGQTDDVSFKPTPARYVMIYCTKRGTRWGSSMSEFEVR